MHLTASATSGARMSWLNDPVVLAGLSLIVVQTIVRSAALYQGWFYGDDFEFLSDATGRSLSISYLMEPHDSQLMPAGMLSIWTVGQSGAFNWPLAATVVVVLQLLASLACWHMLCRVFGVQWWCLGLLGLYLFSTMTLTAFMWWAAAINQVPCQLACFLALTFHVQYLRTGRRLYATVTAAALVLGLLFYVKALLIVIPIGLVTYFYFTERDAPLRTRFRSMLREHRYSWVLYGTIVAVYVQYYLRHVPNPVAGETNVPYAELFDTLLRVSFGPVLLGGPWRWSNENPPLGLVATPEWAVTLSWVAIGVVVALLWRARRFDWRGLVVIGPYLLLSWVLVARGRASLIGEVAGLELRYLADAAPVIVLGIGLIVAGRNGIEQVPERPAPLQFPQWNLRHTAAAGVVLVAVVGTVVSTVRYVHFWSGPFPAKSFTQNVIRESKQDGVRVADVAVPDLVLTGTSFPYNLPSRLFKPLGEDRVSATTLGNDLDILTSSGTVKPAAVSGARSAAGPLPDCGYAVRSSSTPVQMLGTPPDYFWWLEMSYLASDDGTVQLTIDGHPHLVPVRKGLHRLLIQREGPVSSLAVRSLTPDLGLCVDTVTIGDIAPVRTP